MLFDYFDARDTNPAHFVNRETRRAQLKEEIDRYLKLPDRRRGRHWAVIGQKGVGKSIFTRAVLNDLRREHSAETVFVEVDCRQRTSWRDVLAALTWGIVEELNGMPARAPRELIETAQIAHTLSSFTDATRRQLHENVVQYKSALKLGGKRSLLKFLSFDAGIDLERGKKNLEAIEGSVRFDEPRLSRMVIALLRDVVAANHNVVIYIDNIDELNHDYSSDDALQRIKRDVEGILDLSEAPVALVLNMRTYFSRVLRRINPAVVKLKGLADAELVKILDKRLDHERAELRTARSGINDAVLELAARSPTPLAFLDWFKFLFRYDYLPDRRSEGEREYLENHFASLEPDLIQGVVDAFSQPDASISAAELEAACGGDSHVRRQMEELQIVLPLDFWAANRFTLDSVLQLLHRGD